MFNNGWNLFPGNIMKKSIFGGGLTPKHYSFSKMVAKPRVGPLAQENLLPFTKGPTCSLKVIPFFESFLSFTSPFRSKSKSPKVTCEKVD